MAKDRAVSLFNQRFQSEPQLLAAAPGRVNLIGEHTDYNDGFVFPAAIDRHIHVAAASADGPTDLVSAEVGEGQAFDAETVEPGQVTGWAAYAAGMAWVLRLHTGKPMPNIQAAVTSNLMMGSGVSSSAAIEMAFGVVWNELSGLGLDNKALALLAQKCENQFVGVNCGIMDQMASAMGREGQAMFLDTRTLEITYSSIPSNLAIVLCDTKVPRALSDSAYNQRRRECEEASQAMGVTALRDASVDGLEEQRGKMSATAYRRARHVITENDRCLSFRTALIDNDAEQIGSLMRASHESLRDDYEVSCRELNIMAEAAWAAPGCVGARMTGAGFGGACVALVQKNQLDQFNVEVLGEYKRHSGGPGELISCLASEGASVWGV